LPEPAPLQARTAPAAAAGACAADALSYAAGSAIMVRQIVAVCWWPRNRDTGRFAVPTYVMLANWTDQGARQVKDSPRRVDAAKKQLAEMGGEFKQLFMTMGDFDLIVIYEAPDDAVAARFTLLLGQMGAVRTRTLKAFPEAAYREIMNSLDEPRGR
jgi:uncharacterized protein with GYD domain